MIVVLDVVLDSLLKLFDSSEFVQSKYSDFKTAKKLSIAAFARQFPLRDMLWTSVRS
ncbi:MAG: hypothetical protein JWR21_3721 [Herminiimonas sp.]|nr:hypothetical protein [Herminiimonas sp.]